LKIPVWIQISLAGLLTGVFIYLINWQYPLFGRLTDGRLVPPTGVKVNQTVGDGDRPEDVERDFRKIYDAILAFRKATGHLPVRGGGVDLVEFAKSHPEVDLTEANLTPRDFTHSDRYASGSRSHFEYMFNLRGGRPFAVPMPAVPKPGERDAWVSTDLFLKRNTVVYPNMTAKSNPTGFYIVLWSDGQIERVPPDGKVFVSESDGLTEYYAGQAGVPKNAVSGRRMIRFTSGAVPAGITPDRVQRPNLSKQSK
jgi:hypothetical protein